ncbi:hypothetical protein ASQ66_gp31 [Aeropyrum pernix spindle-shaped virus 1]|uniref:hypothetical protein n=1 Tax=Aeropyrum pernix spindle-shaped virus 1 TaxID=1032473 RepID=UPI00022A29C2|nr:hypothetical protein ASQ66_gp31 [Aeropyrum pernix spindle-shaped virus 1]CCD22119.1 TPA: hypothetical protein [Aeropyrum pernix spindle-shaped virus 1]
MAVRLRRRRRRGSRCPVPRENPRTGRKTKYLGHRVRDVGGSGLDSPREFRGILREVTRDYREGCISKRTARGRLLLLYRLTYPRYNRKARRIPASTRRRLREEIRRAMESL